MTPLSRRRSRLVRGALLASVLAVVAGGSAIAAPAPSVVAGPIGEGASDVSAFFNGTVKGVVHGAVLADGSLRVRTLVRGADPSRSYRVVGSETACGNPILDGLLLVGKAPIMGAFVTKTHAAASLADRPGLLLSIRILRSGGGQVACAEALSYEPLTGVAAPALVFEDVLISSFTRPDRPRGLLFTTAPDTTNPQLRWAFTGLGGVSSFRIVASTAICGIPNTPATETYRSGLLTATYGFTEVTGLDTQAESFRIVAKNGTQLACTGRGRHRQPLM